MGREKAEQMKSLHRIVYASRVTLNVVPDMDETLKDILRVAVRENANQGITGLLIAHRGWFVQALEGPVSAVRSRFGSIVRDPRHRDVNILAEGPSEARLFGAWSMCARVLSATDAAILEVLDRRASFDPAAASERTVVRLLTTVAETHTRALNEQHIALMTPRLAKAS
ncbi:MAG: BLUF domain-containing protein [Caulobacter sp.]|nr:BLUF domain-containing protein [Caulobacter sp.]